MAGVAWWLWGLLMGVGIWRVVLAWQVLAGGSGGLGGALGGMAVGEGAMVHWRRLDQFVGWGAVLVLWMMGSGGKRETRNAKRETENGKHETRNTKRGMQGSTLETGNLKLQSLGERRRGVVFGVVAGVGMLLLAGDIVRDQWKMSGGDSGGELDWGAFGAVGGFVAGGGGCGGGGAGVERCFGGDDGGGRCAEGELGWRGGRRDDFGFVAGGGGAVGAGVDWGDDLFANDDEGG